MPRAYVGVSGVRITAVDPGSGRLSDARPPIVFGWDPTPGLLACQLDPDGRHLRLYRRVDGRVVVDREPFTPFLLAADVGLVRDAPGLVALDRLDGAGDLAWLARFASWPDALTARDRCRDRSGSAQAAASAPYLFPGDAAHTYLLLSGRTSFGGMRFTDLRRLALDIEVITTEGFEFPNAAREGDRIVAVALADTLGFRHVVRGDRRDGGRPHLRRGQPHLARLRRIPRRAHGVRRRRRHRDARGQRGVRAAVLRAGAVSAVRLSVDDPARRGREDRRVAPARVFTVSPRGAGP